MALNVKEIVQGLNQSPSGRTFAFPANGISQEPLHQVKFCLCCLSKWLLFHYSFYKSDEAISIYAVFASRNN